jgi:hypothetical protein
VGKNGQVYTHRAVSRYCDVDFNLERLPSTFLRALGVLRGDQVTLKKVGVN